MVTGVLGTAFAYSVDVHASEPRGDWDGAVELVPSPSEKRSAGKSDTPLTVEEDTFGETRGPRVSSSSSLLGILAVVSRVRQPSSHFVATIRRAGGVSSFARRYSACRTKADQPDQVV